MGLLDLYRVRKPQEDSSVGDETAEEEPAPEPLPRISVSELWPPSPRVKLLYIGIGFFLLNSLLLCIWAYVVISSR